MAGSSKNNKPKRKLNSKGKRLVRRTIAGILMISALIVAAIPEDHSGVAQAVNNNPILDYDADALEARNRDLVPGTTTDFFTRNESTEPIRSSYEIRQIDGQWTLLWKYQYYIPAAGVNGIQGVGVLCDYNDTYKVDELNLTKDIIAGYEIVEQSVYDNYVSTVINPKVFILDKSPYVNGTDGTNPNDVKLYFPEEYAVWESEYAAKLAEYVQ